MSSPPPYRIIIYTSTEPQNTPEPAMYGAGLFIGYDTVPRWTHSGPTAAAARAAMEAFWDRERKQYEPRQAPKKGKPAPGLEPASMSEVEAPEPVSEVADDDEVL
jgi:hypothetical protein